MENSIVMAILHGESEAEERGLSLDDYTCDDIHEWIMESGGYSEFDHYC